MVHVSFSIENRPANLHNILRCRHNKGHFQTTAEMYISKVNSQYCLSNEHFYTVILRDQMNCHHTVQLNKPENDIRNSITIIR